MALRVVPDPAPDPLEGVVVRLPSGELARVESVEHEYDDGCTLCYLDGPYKGTQTMRDTYAVRRYPVVYG